MARVYGCILAVYPAVYMARTRPCNGGVHGCAHGRERAVYTAAYGPCTGTRAVYTARAQCVTTIFFAKDTFYAENETYS